MLVQAVYLAKLTVMKHYSISALRMACLEVVPLYLLVWRLVWGQPVLKHSISRQRAGKQCDAG